MPAEMIDNALTKPMAGNSSCQDTTPPRLDSYNVHNKFELLVIYEPLHEFLDAPDIDRTTSPQKEPQPRYRVETISTLDEEYLATHFLFQDIKNIRLAVCQLWEHYTSGMSIVALSITVDIAINLVKDFEQNVIQQIPSKTDYESIMKLFYRAQCLNRGHSPSTKQQPGDLFNFVVYDLASDVMLPTYSTLRSLQDLIQRDTVPQHKPGHLGYRDLSTDLSTKTSREMFKDNQSVLFEAFLDLALMAMITSKSPMAEDELVRGIRDMSPGKAIPLWLVFAAQCFLDAQHVLKQDLPRPYAELVQSVKAITATIEQNMKFHESLRINNWPKQNDFEFSELLRVIQQWIKQDVVVEKLKKVCVTFRELI